MNHDAAQAPGVVMMDAMIARAKAACARIRSVLAATPPTRRVIFHRRQQQLRVMEDTLARLMMDRDATLDIAGGTMNASPRTRDKYPSCSSVFW